MIKSLSARTAEPLLLAPQYLGFAADLARMEKGEGADFDFKLEVSAVYGVPYQAFAAEKDFAFADGIAYIPVRGSLINRSTWSSSYSTGYKFIQSRLDMALADPDVKGIVLDVDSFGGEAAGCFECAEAIRAARALKPITAMVDSNAYSAGYAIASAATKVVLIPSGGAGSIGVITMHVDQSKALDEYGVKVTLIFAGDHKADGNSFEPLPPAVREAIQARLDDRYAAFTGLVDTNRGLAEGSARATQARTYGADEALALGLIDSIAPAPDALAEFRDFLCSATSDIQLEAEMADEATAKAQADKAAADAKTAERARVNGILTHAEAAGRSDLANHLAFKTDMSVDDAVAMLAVAPKAAAAAAAAATPAADANLLAPAMARAGTPGITPDAAAPAGGASGEKTDEEKGKEAASAILTSLTLATGRKF